MYGVRFNCAFNDIVYSNLSWSTTDETLRGVSMNFVDGETGFGLSDQDRAVA